MTSIFRRAGNLISAALRLQPKRVYVGADLEGNKYYEIFPQVYFWGLWENDKHIRMVEPFKITTKPINEPVQVTIEWDSWLRKKRNNPPTIEELIKNVEQHRIMQERIKATEDKHIKHANASSSLKQNFNAGLSRTKPEKESQTVDSWSSDKS